MAKGQYKERGSNKHTPDVSEVNAAALQAEVKSFASGLGLAAAGVSSGFDDSDFRPPTAGHTDKAKLIRTNDSSRSQPDTQKGKKAERPGVKPPAVKPGLGQPQPEVPDIVRERNWNAGVGPRPGQSPCQTFPVLAQQDASVELASTADGHNSGLL